MRIAIVDDALVDSDALSSFVQHFCDLQHLQVDLETFHSGEEFLAAHELSKYEIVFIDIYMGGIDGMETARRLREHGDDCLLIFCTSSQAHAVESYDVRAFYYLVKPYNYQKLCEVLSRCNDALRNKSRFIEVKEGRMMVKILLRDIVYTDYFNHYIQIHTKERMIRSYMPFADFSKLLLCYPQFLCCYRNCIINMDWVRGMDDRDFEMEGGDRVPMTRAMRMELRQKYQDYIFAKLAEGG